MISWPLFAIAILFFIIGAAFFGNAKRGTQNSLGGIIALIALVIAALGALARVAGAHDHSRPDLTPWFDKLKSNAGALCCTGNDGTRLADADWRSSKGGYQVFLDGDWRDVPEGAVVTEPNLSGRTMVWPRRSYLGGLRIICFMPGPGA